ncbi:hypothetical protein GCM10022393_32340 [Aquimarina addita]|uniref:GLPGLI family protein n=1 Tax=Aquimarina addita TaxID=870485 RepID=A0ABP6UP11_9FLAO
MNTIFKFTLFLFPFLIFAQSYEITYQRYASRYDGNLDDVIKRLTNPKSDIHKEQKNELTLVYTDGISICGSNLVGYINKNASKEEYTPQVSQTIHYKNQKDNTLIKSLPNWIPAIYGQDIRVKSKLLSFDWQITNTTSSISGYNCHLATTTLDNGDKIIAWYTDQIGINDGPYNYWGLPGLILQLQISNRVLLIGTSVKKLDKIIEIPIPDKGDIMTPEEFKVLQEEVLKPRTITRPDGSTVTIRRSE